MRRSALLAAAIIGGVFGLSTSGARAACTGLSLTLTTTVSWLGGSGSGYDVFDASDHGQTVSFRVNKGGGSGCSYFVTATAGGSGSFNNRRLTAGGNTPTYNLFTSATKTNILKDLPAATASQVISGNFGSSNVSQTQTYFYDIPPQQVVQPGTYQDTVQFKLFNGTIASNTLVQTVSVTHRAIVPAAAEISLVPTGQPFIQSSTTQSLNFGTLSTGQSLGFDMRARGNNGYDVTMQSANAGVMKIAGDPSTVPYTLTVSGSAVNLSSGGAVNVSSVTAPTGLNGNLSPILVTIGSVAGAAAGSYSDTITIVVTSK